MLSESQREIRDEIVTLALNKTKTLLSKELRTSENAYVSELQEMVSIIEQLNQLN